MTVEDSPPLGYFSLSTFLVFQIFEAVVSYYKSSCALWSLVIFVTQPEF